MPKRGHPSSPESDQNTKAYDYGRLPFIHQAIEETLAIELRQ
jgi:hypothetical protein